MWFLPTNPNSLGAARDFAHVPYYSGYQAVKHGLNALSGLGNAFKGFGVGQVLGNIPNRMYPTNYRERTVITMPGKLDFKYKPKLNTRKRVQFSRSSYLRRRFMKKRNKF